MFMALRASAQGNTAGRWSGKYTDGLGKTVKVKKSLQRIRVQLDYDRGDVSFYDPEDMTHIYTYRDTFTEKLFPYFSILERLVMQKLLISKSVKLIFLCDVQKSVFLLLHARAFFAIFAVLSPSTSLRYLDSVKTLLTAQDQKIQLHEAQLTNISSGIKELTDSHAELKSGVDNQVRYLAAQLQQIINQLEEITKPKTETASTPCHATCSAVCIASPCSTSFPRKVFRRVPSAGFQSPATAEAGKQMGG
ncbi:hypothetical protein L3Q82_006830 [Scortum barcoo]|uniref:Uncharacterized protein n=1 Tax=Scortum barcoo TaxID=214431 RepID=A0ACB8WVX2_9TELE|nr:hypothetical protein L3Q82_006830 [Scortum barcoo]